MNNINPFLMDIDKYTRKLNPIGQYRQQAAAFISWMTNAPYEETLAFVKKETSKSGRFPIIDKKLTYTERDHTGDRHIKEGSFYNYLTTAWKRKAIMAPSMTTYKSVEEEESLLRVGIRVNTGVRSKAKKAMFILLSNGKTWEAGIQDSIQGSMKQYNNSLSGAQGTESTALYNKTAHSSMTSNCRVTANYGAANSERLLIGNRHYWGYQAPLNNLISTCTNTDYDRLKAVMDKYHLHYPTEEETLKCILRSSDQYWTNARVTEVYRQVIQKLTPIQRAAFVYTGDLYHLAMYNPEVVHSFISGLSTYVHVEPGTVPRETMDAVWSNSNDSLLFLAAQIMGEETVNVSLNSLNYNKLSADEKTKRSAHNAHLEEIITSVMGNILKTISSFADFIQTFMTTANIPGSVAYYPDSIRQVVITGDTDSNIFTVDNWVEWHCGALKTGKWEYGVAAAMVFLAEQNIAHVLAIMSANMGVAKEDLFVIAMKNEFSFVPYIPMMVAKHYAALKRCREGIIFDKVKLELKGVHMKSSNAPAVINEASKKMITDMLVEIRDTSKLSIEKYIAQVVEIEHHITTSLKEGKTGFFRFQQIKKATSYKNPNPFRNNYGGYLFWNRVFAQETAVCPPPPYMALKVNLDIKNKRQFEQWLEDHPDIAPAVNQWLDDKMADAAKENEKAGIMRNVKRSIIKTVSVPVDIAYTYKLPEAIAKCIDTRKTVFDMCKTFYILLEALNISLPNVSEKKRILFSDVYDSVDGKLVDKNIQFESIQPIELDHVEMNEYVELKEGIFGNENENPDDSIELDS